MKYPRKWEKIKRFTYRLKVPGGWIVSDTGGAGLGICFFPDPNYEWMLEEETV